MPRRTRPVLLLLLLLGFTAALGVMLSDEPPAAPRVQARLRAEERVAQVASSAPAAEATSSAEATTSSVVTRSGPEVTSLDPRGVPLAGMALLDDAPLAGATLRFTSAEATREVVTRDDGALEVSLAPGDWSILVVSGSPDLRGSAHLFDDRAALERAVARPRPMSLRLLSGTPHLPVAAAPDDAAPALLLRFSSPWVLEGLVVDAGTNAPIPAARVFTDGADDHDATTTDDGGAFRLVTPRAREGSGPTVCVDAPGYGRTSVQLDPARDVGARRRPVRLAMRRPLSLRGRVVDLRGRPLRARVEAQFELPDARSGGHTRWSSLLADVDADGRFVVEGIPRGAGRDRRAGPHAARVELSVSCAGHATARLQPEVRDDAAPLDISLLALHEVTGRVVDPAGRPVTGAHVSARTPTLSSSAMATVTAPDGRFALTTPERAVLRVRADGFPDARLELWSPVEDLVVRLDAPGPAIQGRVVDHQGLPVEDVTVLAAWTLGEADTLELEAPGVRLVERGLRHATARCAPAGRFTLREVPRDGAMTLRVVRFGSLQDRPRVEVTPGARDVTLVLDPPRGRVRAALELSDDVQPAPRVRVAVRDARGRWGEELALTTHRGHATAQLALAPGDHLLLVTAPGARPLVRPLHVVADQDADLGTLRLERGGGRLEVDVTWPEGPAPSVRVRCRDPATGLEWVEDGPAPSALDVPLVWSSLPAGPVTLEVVARGASERILRTRDVMLRDGETTRLELELASALRDALPVGDHEPR